MKNKRLEQLLKSGVEQSVPDVLDGVLSGCGDKKGRVIDLVQTNHTSSRKKKAWIAAASAVAAVAVLALGTWFGLGQMQANRVDSVIALDVNPSIELEVNKEETVLKATALNADAATVLGDMDLKGTDLDVAINALIGSLVKNGYLSELSNSILISVENDNTAKSEALNQRLTAEISRILESNSLNGAVLGQTVSAQAEVQQLADQYSISVGKASLIQRLLQTNTTYRFEDLAKLSINELNLLAEGKSTQLGDITSTGQASDKAYIGADKAKQLALNHVGVAESDTTQMKVELDFDHGWMVYEVEFKAGGKEYDLEINAVDGSIVKSDIDVDDDWHPGSAPSSSNPATSAPSSSSSTSSQASSSGTNSIGESRAWEIALAHAGVTSSDTRNTKIKFDYEDGIAVYEVEFDAGYTEYEYEIDASTGAIRKASRDDADGAWNGATTSSGNGTSYISNDQAKQIAFQHAGVSSSQVQMEKLELDYDDGMAVYEIEFRVGRMEYEYEINASTGSILTWQSENY